MQAFIRSWWEKYQKIKEKQKSFLKLPCHWNSHSIRWFCRGWIYSSSQKSPQELEFLMYVMRTPFPTSAMLLTWLLTWICVIVVSVCTEGLQIANKKAGLPSKFHSQDIWQGVAVNEANSCGKAKLIVTEQEGAREQKLNLLTVSHGLILTSVHSFLPCRQSFEGKAAERKLWRTLLWGVWAGTLAHWERMLVLVHMSRSWLFVSGAFGRVLTPTGEAARVNLTVSVGMWGLPRPLGKASALVRWLHLQNQIIGHILGSQKVQELLSVIALHELEKSLPGAEQQIEKRFELSQQYLISDNLFLWH